MQKFKYRTLMLFFIFIFFLTSACANYGGQAKRDGNQQNIQKLNMQQSADNDLAVIQIRSNNGGSYVSLNKLVSMLDFNSEWDEATQTYNIGDTDVIYKVKVNSIHAEKAEQDVQLTSEPIMLNGEVWVPIEVAYKLFEEGMDYEIRDQQLIIYPNYNEVNTDATNEELDFGDDPADPAGDNEDLDEDALDIEDISSPDQQDKEVWSPDKDDESTTVFTRKRVNANRLIATGKKYLGVKYKFGAGKYARTKRFDCSSFIQQLYNTYGVRLPRISRNQAKYGIYISRKNLRKGDLLYFYVPGRFRKNKTVGHVGVYIGNNKMLHSSPKPKNGVQITNINKSYWKRTYMGAKRVIR
jgi:cell wall-associated NlpC family hydrolase